MNNYSLVSLFDSQKERLEEQLKGLFLPKDAEKIKKTVSDHLLSLFDRDGDFRMSLTQAEDYILNAALSLLNAQQEIGKAAYVQPEKYFSSSRPSNDSDIEDTTPQHQTQPHPKFVNINPFLNTQTNAATSLLGAGGGAFIGRFLGGGWGAVFGAIAGTAITIYLSNYRGFQNRAVCAQTKPLSTKPEKPLTDTIAVDVEQFITITRKICESVDNLIDTFRAQIRRVVDKYESQEKPTLEKEYLPLLEELQSLIGYKRAHADDDKFVKKISERIEDVVETIGNYNLSVVDFDGNNPEYFVNVPSPNTEITKQVFPAIAKGENIILKGKLFVPEK